MITFFLRYWQIGAGAALGGLIACAPVYLYGKAEGRQQAAISSLTASVKTLRDKGDINAQISISHAADLCRNFGLPDSEQPECMRRVRAASTKP